MFLCPCSVASVDFGAVVARCGCVGLSVSVSAWGMCGGKSVGVFVSSL